MFRQNLRAQVGFGFKKPIFIANTLSQIPEFEMQTWFQPSAHLEQNSYFKECLWFHCCWSSQMSAHKDYRATELEAGKKIDRTFSD